MRVKPPGDGAPPIRGVDEAQAPEPAAKAAEVTGAAPVAPAEGARPAEPLDPIREVARRLRAGEIDAQKALDLLIDDVVDRQVGRAASDRRALAAELKAILRRQTELDPYLASKVRRLGNRS